MKGIHTKGNVTTSPLYDDGEYSLWLEHVCLIKPRMMMIYFGLCGIKMVNL